MRKGLPLFLASLMALFVAAMAEAATFQASGSFSGGDFVPAGVSPDPFPVTTFSVVFTLDEDPSDTDTTEGFLDEFSGVTVGSTTYDLSNTYFLARTNIDSTTSFFIGDDEPDGIGLAEDDFVAAFGGGPILPAVGDSIVINLNELLIDDSDAVGSSRAQTLSGSVTILRLPDPAFATTASVSVPNTVHLLLWLLLAVTGIFAVRRISNNR